MRTLHILTKQFELYNIIILSPFSLCTEPDDDYTSSYTGTTGDSGFGDATQFLKIPLEPPQYSSTTDPSLSSLADTLAPDSPSYYKAIHKEEVGDPSYYKFVSKESQARKWQGE